MKECKLTGIEGIVCKLQNECYLKDLFLKHEAPYKYNENSGPTAPETIAVNHLLQAQNAAGCLKQTEILEIAKNQVEIAKNQTPHS